MSTYHSLAEAQTALECHRARMKQLDATCQHDVGVRWYKGESVCLRCWLCPVPGYPSGNGKNKVTPSTTLDTPK